MMKFNSPRYYCFLAVKPPLSNESSKDNFNMRGESNFKVMRLKNRGDSNIRVCRTGYE